jgi:hypothetical protein
MVSLAILVKPSSHWGDADAIESTQKEGPTNPARAVR